MDSEERREFLIGFGNALRTATEFGCQDWGCSFNDTTGKVEVSCKAFTEKKATNMVLFVFGQSNSANHGRGQYRSKFEVVNFNPITGKCYKAVDPLLGASGSGSSPWPQLGDRLIEETPLERVLIISIGIGGTKIEQWNEYGAFAYRVESSAKQLRQSGIEVTHVAWHQGEANKKDSKELYTSNFRLLEKHLRNSGIDAPVFIATASICMDLGSDEIRSAQQSIPQLIDGVYPGAHTDSLDRYEDRYDNCHFSEIGMNKHADLWFDVFQSFEHSKSSSQS